MIVYIIHTVWNGLPLALRLLPRVHSDRFCSIIKLCSVAELWWGALIRSSLEVKLYKYLQWIIFVSKLQKNHQYCIVLYLPLFSNMGDKTHPFAISLCYQSTSNSARNVNTIKLIYTNKLIFLPIEFLTYLAVTVSINKSLLTLTVKCTMLRCFIQEIQLLILDRLITSPAKNYRRKKRRKK